MSLISKHFLTIGHRQVHYLRCGAGPALILLHNSPLSAVSLRDMIETLSEQYTVIAPDAAGHGLTSPLDGIISIERLADGLASLINTMELEKPLIVGTGSGAHIALTFAVRHGVKASGIICLDMPVWNERELKKLRQSHEAFITPTPDGSHLIRRWHALRHQGNTVDECQDQLLDMLATTSPLVACDTQHWLDAYSGDALHLIYDEIKPSAHFAERLTTKVPVKLLNPDALLDYINAFAKDEERSIAPEPPEVDLAPPPYVTKAYTEISNHEIVMHGRAGTTGGGSLLLLHEPGFSAAEFDDYLSGLSAEVTVLAPNMPAEFVKPAFIDECLDMLPEGTIIVARGGAAALALEAIEKIKHSIGGLILDEPLLFDKEIDGDAKAFMKVPAKPSRYGEHLITLWGHLRDRTHFWPWHSSNRILGENEEDSQRLKHQFTAALQAGAHYQKLINKICKTDISDQIIQASYPLVILSDPEHPSARGLRRTSQQAAQAIVIDQTGAEGVMAAMVGLGAR